MGARGITSQALFDAIHSKAVAYYETVSIDVGAGYYITNAPVDITVDNQLYRSFGQLISFDAVEENVDLEIAELTLSISAIAAYDNDNNSFAQTILASEYVDKTVQIKRVYFDMHNDVVGSVEIFKGRIDKGSIATDISGTSSVEISVSSHWVDFSRANGRFTNSNSQQNLFSNDVGFDYAVEVQKEIEWKE